MAFYMEEAFSKVPFAHLSMERIKEIRQAFDIVRCLYDNETRELLMARISFEYVERLRIFSTPSRQLDGDLNRLNSCPRLRNKQIPLELWLENAVTEVFSNTLQEICFEKALTELRAGPFEQSDATKLMVKGFDALIEMIQADPDVRMAVSYYRKILEQIGKEFTVIADYMSLYDELHQLKLIWPDSDVVATIFIAQRGLLINQSTTLKRATVEMHAIYKNGIVDGSEYEWISKLERSQIELETAITRSDKDEIEEKLNWINRNLSLELSRMGICVKAAIDKLHLEDLVKAMYDVFTTLTRLSPDGVSRQLKRLKIGIDEVTKLKDSIKNLARQHDDWQNIDTLLRMLSDTLKSVQGKQSSAAEEREAIGNLAVIKEIIESKVIPRIEDDSTIFSRRLLNAAQQFIGAVEMSDVNRAEQAFYVVNDLAEHVLFEISGRIWADLRVLDNNLQNINDELKFNRDFGS